MAAKYNSSSDTDDENRFVYSNHAYDLWAYADILHQKLKDGSYENFSYEDIINKLDKIFCSALYSLENHFKIEEKMKYGSTLNEMGEIIEHIKYTYTGWNTSFEKKREEFLEKLQRFDVLARSIK